MKPEKNKIGGEKVEQSAVFACKEEKDDTIIMNKLKTLLALIMNSE